MGIFGKLFKKQKKESDTKERPREPMADENPFDEYLDCLEMICPRPIFEVSQKLKALDSGKILKVVCKDQAFENDIRAWCHRTGNTLGKLVKEGDLITVYITKA